MILIDQRIIYRDAEMSSLPGKDWCIQEIINSTSSSSSNLQFSGKKRIYLEVWEIWGKFWLVKNSFWSPQYWRWNNEGSRKEVLKRSASLIPTLFQTRLVNYRGLARKFMKFVENKQRKTIVCTNILDWLISLGCMFKNKH